MESRPPELPTVPPNRSSSSVHATDYLRPVPTPRQVSTQTGPAESENDPDQIHKEVEKVRRRVCHIETEVEGPYVFVMVVLGFYRRCSPSRSLSHSLVSEVPYGGIPGKL